MPEKILALQLWHKMLSTNQIAIFFDHQYIRMQSSDILDFLHGENHQRNISSETTTSGWVWPVVSPNESDCRTV